VDGFLRALHEFSKSLADMEDVYPDLCAKTDAAFSTTMDLKCAILSKYK